MDANSIYWRDIGKDVSTDPKLPVTALDGRIMKCPLAGCKGSPTVLAANTANRVTAPGTLVIDDTTVYWSDVDIDSGVWDIRKCSKGGCDAGSSELTPAFVVSLAADTSHVYWSTGYQASVMECAAGGCDAMPGTLFAGSNQETGSLTFGIAADETDVYWGAFNGFVWRCAKAGCDNKPSLFQSTFATAVSVAVDANNVYWLDNRSLGLGQVVKCPKHTPCLGDPITLATGLSYGFAIATDGATVYWTEWGDGTNTGRVRACASAGCNGTPTVIAEGLIGPSGIAVDEHNVYFTTFGITSDDGSVFVRPK